MPQWSDQPDAGAAAYAFRIVRTPASTPIEAIVTSDQLHGCPTHFVSNRTIPCERDDACPLCQQGFSWRWHGYLSCVFLRGMEHVLFECTAAAAETFRTYIGQHRGLRGCHFLAKRPSGRLNGRVIIQAKPIDLTKFRLPDAPNVREILCHIWGVQYTEPDATTVDRPPFRSIRVPHNPLDARYGGNGRNNP